MQRIHTIQEEDGTSSRFTERYSGFDQMQHNEDNGKGLYFDYRPLSFYFSIGKIKIGL